MLFIASLSARPSLGPRVKKYTHLITVIVLCFMAVGYRLLYISVLPETNCRYVKGLVASRYVCTPADFFSSRLRMYIPTHGAGEVCTTLEGENI